MDYLRLSVWPVRLVAFWGWPLPLTLAEAWPQFALVAALAAGSIVWYLSAPRLAFCLLWFFVTLAPTSSFVPIATEVGADRRMYLPLAGLVTMVIAACWHAVTGAARKERGPRDSIWRTGLTPVRDSSDLPLPEQAGGRAMWLVMPAVALVGVLGWTTVARNREYGTALRLAADDRRAPAHRRGASDPRGAAGTGQPRS